MRRFITFTASLALFMSVFLWSASAANAQRGRSGGGGARPSFSGGARPSFSGGARPSFSGGVRPAVGFSGGVAGHSVSGFRVGGFPLNNGFYRPYPHNFSTFRHNYRPYYAVGFWPYFGYGLGLGAYGYYAPYYVASAYNSFYPDPGIMALQDPQAPPSQDRPPADDAAHLQLMVPENAEVLVDGVKTTQIGTAREFVSPVLAPGTRYVYKITVRYTDANGKQVEDTRDIRFQANDWFSVDFTRPAPTLPPPTPAPKINKQP
jgi:uncharacterized protein (TIGR03000 family)